ncbi:hypothetical protein E5288_WYG000096 [Bos mutus]|uniref:Uncharacterized protein n=1 Tax=Bos mutus TaxID=72004 RepID=A0A6B0RJE3_9CETA|nr:hypothetical protein [Bos mutus]
MRLLLTTAGRKCATQRPVTIQVPYAHRPGPCALRLNRSLVQNPQSIPGDLGPASSFPTWHRRYVRQKDKGEAIINENRTLGEFQKAGVAMAHQLYNISKPPSPAPPGRVPGTVQTPELQDCPKAGHR